MSYTYVCPRCGHDDPKPCWVCDGKRQIVVEDEPVRVVSRGATWIFTLPPTPDYVLDGWSCQYHSRGFCHNPLDCDMVPKWKLKPRTMATVAAEQAEEKVDRAFQVQGYIEEIAQLRRDLHNLQGRYRAEIAENGASKLLIQDLQSEIARHHKDFVRISQLSEAAERFADVNPERIKLIRTIRNIVG